jgi:hypothetical protein
MRSGHAVPEQATSAYLPQKGLFAPDKCCHGLEALGTASVAQFVLDGVQGRDQPADGADV